MPKTKNPNTAIRARPTCARCGDTGSIAGGHVYPGTHAAQRQERCPDCAPAPKPEAITRAVRQTEERTRAVVLLFEGLVAQSDVSAISMEAPVGLVSYHHDGHNYAVFLTVTETQ